MDGTLAETERDGHRVAFNLAFEACRLDWRWDELEYGRLLRIAGGQERLLHYLATRDDAPAQAEERALLARRLHESKSAFYADLVHAGGIRLRAGVINVLEQCRARGQLMGIATTTSRSNVEALLSIHLGRQWHDWFAVIVCGEDVERKKPDPEVYLRAVATLAIDSRCALAVEDSPAGVAATRAAGVPVIVTRSAYFADAIIEGACAIGPGLYTHDDWQPAARTPGGPDRPIELDDLVAWWTMGARGIAPPQV